MLKLDIQFFGGRGASGGNYRPSSPSGGGSGNFSPYGMGDVIPGQGGLKQAIGTKGKPYSVDNALKNVNPHHSYEYSEYSENCQRCVVAYELRRRGYNVTALPTYQGDTLPVVNSFGNGRWQMAFKGAKTVSVGSSSPKKTQANLEAKMKSYGKGSRAIVRIPGHVFNCENSGGKVIYVEAQTGKRYTSKEVFSNLSPKQSSQVRLMRTDNLRISDRARNLVKLAK